MGRAATGNDNAAAGSGGRVAHNGAVGKAQRNNTDATCTTAGSHVAGDSAVEDVDGAAGDAAGAGRRVARDAAVCQSQRAPVCNAASCESCRVASDGTVGESQPA